MAAEQGQDLTGLVVAMTDLIPTEGENQSLFVAMLREPFIFRGLYMTVVEDKNTWNSKTYTEGEVIATGMTVEALKGAATLLALALTRD